MTAPAPGAISNSDYNFLRTFLRDQMGYELGEGKEYLVDGRLAPVAATLGFGDVSSLLHQLRISPDPKLRDAIIDAMAINETYFFRAPRVFESLRQRIIPTLQMSRRGTRLLRIWSGGCSTGQEAYSIAMLMADHFPDLHDWNVQLIGTDISDQSLERARRGVYNQFEVQRGLPIQSLLKHFRKIGDSWQISDELRRRVSFQKLNLLDNYNSLFGPFDIIMIRNVLIYFDRSMLGPMFDKLRQAIANDGYLILGESETIIGLTDKFTIPGGETDYYAPTPIC
jgi:chemotaxis protein methyltransferase CheR